MKKILVFISMLALGGCHPYEFWMGGPHIVSCEILTSLAGVDHNEDMATLRDTAAIDMNYFGATQYLITMGVRLDHGDGFRMMLRPVVEHRDVRDSGIIVIATTSGVMIDPSEHQILLRPEETLVPNQIVHISLLSQNHYVQVIMDCDTVFRGWSKRNESDDVVVQALQGSQVEVIDPDWAAIPGE